MAFLVLMLATINPPINHVSDEYHGLENPLANIRHDHYQTLGHSHLRLFATRVMNALLRVHGFTVLANHGGTWGLPRIGRLLARAWPYYGLYTTAFGQKVHE